MGYTYSTPRLYRVCRHISSIAGGRGRDRAASERRASREPHAGLGEASPVLHGAEAAQREHVRAGTRETRPD